MRRLMQASFLEEGFSYIGDDLHDVPGSLWRNRSILKFALHVDHRQYQHRIKAVPRAFLQDKLRKLLCFSFADIGPVRPYNGIDPDQVFRYWLLPQDGSVGGGQGSFPTQE